MPLLFHFGTHLYNLFHFVSSALSAIIERSLNIPCRMLEHNDNDIVEAELEFLFPFNGRNVKGYIDRFGRTKGSEYIVIDFKTGSSV